MTPLNPRRIVLVSEWTVGLGDRLLLTGLVEYLRFSFPASELELYTHDARAVFANNPHLAATGSLAEGRAAVRAAGSDPAMRVVTVDDLDLTTGDHVFDALAARTGFAIPAEFRTIRIYPSSADLAAAGRARGLIAELSGGRPAVALCPANTAPHKTLGRESWQAVADRLAAVALVVAFGTPADFALDNVLDLRGAVTLHQIPEALAACDAALCVSSGFLHVAAASGCHIALADFGPARPHYWMPYRRGVRGHDTAYFGNGCDRLGPCITEFNDIHRSDAPAAERAARQYGHCLYSDYRCRAAMDPAVAYLVNRVTRRVGSAG